MKCKNRITDKPFIKITSKVLWSMVGSLLIIVGTLLGRWSSNVDFKLSEVANACNKLDNRVIPLEVMLPEIKKSLDNFILEYRRDKRNK
jgi:hypothetical protein